MPRRNEGPSHRWNKKRKCFYIYWTENGRSRERSTGTAKSDEAEIVFAQFMQRYIRRLGPRDPAEVLTSDVIGDYLDHLEGNPAKDGARAGYAALPLAEFFTGRVLSEVPALVEAYGKWRNRSLSTVRRELGVLQSAIKHAHTVSLTISRPVTFTRPAESQPRERYLTRSEAAWLVAAALGFAPVALNIKTRRPMLWKRLARPQYHLARFILLGLYTGRRKEAILSLRWPKVDLAARRIDFRRDGQPETKKKRGRCSISSRLTAHLRRGKKHDHDLGHVITWNGEPLRDIKTAFNNAVERAFLEDVSPHTLKHTAATWLMQQGMDVFKVSDFLATSVETILKHYGHHNPDHQSEVADAISRRPENARRIR